MGNKQFLAPSHSKISSERTSGFTLDCISYMDMFSTPPAIPISMNPAWILPASVAMVSNPEEHNLFMATVGTRSGQPAKY